MKKLALSLILFTPSVFAASFDCNKAATFIEKSICGNERIGNLDDELAVNFKAVKDSSSNEEAKELIASQKQWLSVRNKCTDDKCLIDSYSKRIAAVAGNSSVSNIPATYIDGEYSGKNLSMELITLDSEKSITAARVITTSDQGCTGDIAGIGTLTGKILKFQNYTKEEGAESCVITVTLKDGKKGKKVAEISDGADCSYFHGVNCSFNGTVHQK